DTLAKGLVIVESPAKAKTIQKYLGTGYTVEASLGHVKDLPKSTLGVDIENDFDTEYIVIPGKEKVVARLKKLAGSADMIYLAPDPDREGEAKIKAFEKKRYWTIDAHLAASKPPAFDARFLGKGEEKIEIPNGDEAEKIRAAVEKADWLVRTVDRKERRRNAAPPFTTSKLQQDSSRKLRFSVKRTMMIAQRLYEGVELGEEGSVGLITYMRTDSTRVS